MKVFFSLIRQQISDGISGYEITSIVHIDRLDILRPSQTLLYTYTQICVRVNPPSIDNDDQVWTQIRTVSDLLLH